VQDSSTCRLSGSQQAFKEQVLKIDISGLKLVFWGGSADIGESDGGGGGGGGGTFDWTTWLVFPLTIYIYTLHFHKCLLLQTLLIISSYPLLPPLLSQLRPYTPESTGSRPISEVKQVLAQSVLWWGTTREYCVL
jgi:hypothetical protein